MNLFKKPKQDITKQPGEGRILPLVFRLIIPVVICKVIILIPLCFLLTHFMGFKGVYLSEGIADFAAGIITSAVIFTSFPKIFKKREAEVKAKKIKTD